MKKIISNLLIVAIMMASVLAIIPVSAASAGEAITNAEEFAAMDPAGKYYLANDIAISAFYEDKFTGTFDGKGHTVTVVGATALFRNIEGATVENINIVSEWESEVTPIDSAGNALPIGSLACCAFGNFYNIHADVDIKYTGKAPKESYKTMSVAGLIGQANGQTVLDSCTVKGSIDQSNNTFATSLSTGRAGLIGEVNAAGKVEIINCANYADITALSFKSGVGGIIGGTSSTGANNITIENTVNYGDINVAAGSEASDASSRGVGGLIGFVWGRNMNTRVTITDSRNYGDITNTPGAIKKGDQIGGMIGMFWGGTELVLKNCVNSGNITNICDAADVAAGMVAYIEGYNLNWATNTEGKIIIKNCVNIGNM